jgi:hypothetical protein
MSPVQWIWVVFVIAMLVALAVTAMWAFGRRRR